MNKIFKLMIVLVILSLNIFIIKKNEIYAFSKGSDLDFLIENKKNQEEIKSKIENLKQSLEIKTKENEQDEIEVVSLSFVQDTNLDSKDILNKEVSNKEEEKLYLEKQLEEYMIEGIRIEKSIEENMHNYLLENGLDFSSGIWPLPSYNEISSSFGSRIHPISKKQSFHKGIDIPAPQNTDILCVDDGVVVFSGMQNGYGNVVKIKHFDGKQTIYAHNTLNLVSEGDIIKQGQAIAKVGSTGNSTGNHLHFETIVNETNINPLSTVSK